MRSLKRPVHRLKKLIDYWSMPHFLLGMLVALFGRVLEYPPVPLFFVTIVIAIVWEFFERRIHIREARMNVASDIFMPLLAYVVTLWLVGEERTNHEQRVALLMVTIIFYSLVSYAAWRARLDRDPDFLG